MEVGGDKYHISEISSAEQSRNKEEANHDPNQRSLHNSFWHNFLFCGHDILALPLTGVFARGLFGQTQGTLFFLLFHDDPAHAIAHFH